MAYQKRTNFIEKKIEQDILYFDDQKMSQPLNQYKQQMTML